MALFPFLPLSLALVRRGMEDGGSLVSGIVRRRTFLLLLLLLLLLLCLGVRLVALGLPVS